MSAPGVLERRPRGRLASGLAEIVDRLLPQLAPESVMGEPLDLAAEAIPVERLDRLDEPRVKAASTLLQQSPVRDVVRQRVLEGILEIWIQPGLVEKLGGLQVVESATERLVRQVGDRLEQREWNVLADDGGHLEEAFVLRGEPIDARCQHRLHRGRDPDRLDRLPQPIPSPLPGQRLGLHQRPDGLLHEERVPAPDEELLEPSEPGIVAEKRIEQLPGAVGRQGVQPHLAVGRLAAPGVLVLGPIGHGQQHAGRPQAVDQAVEQCLRLTVDPVEVLEDQEETRVLTGLRLFECRVGVAAAVDAELGLEIQFRLLK
jgi:hypothetical protein